MNAHARPAASLAWSRPPIPGESLMGFVARNADVHGIDKVSTALRAAGIHTLVPESLPTVHAGKAQAVADLFRTDVEEIRRRTCPAAAVSGRPNSFVDFFGTPIRSAYREVNRRRFSPASLARSDHHRAIWDIRVFSFCPESKERLTSACPHCKATLGWRWTLGIAFCERCGEDLRTVPQPRVTCGDMEALDFTVDLVHPDPERRGRARRMIPAPFAGLDNGEAFEFCIALACAATTEPGAPRAIMRRLKTLKDVARLTPDALAMAGRTLIDWPRSFHDLADATRRAAGERAGHYGLKKELGPLMYLSRDAYLAATAKAQVRAEIDANMGRAGVRLRRRETRADDEWLPLRTASERFGIDPRCLSRIAERPDVDVVKAVAGRSPVLLRAEQVAAIVRERDDAAGVVRTRRRLGVDRPGLDDLARAGLIRRLSGPVEEILKEAAWSRASVEALHAAVMAKAAARPASGASVRLSKAVKRAAVAEIPWAAVMDAILDGRVPVHTHPATDNTALATSVALADAADLAPAFEGTAQGETAAGDRLDRVNGHEAAALLRCTEAFVAALNGAGLLRTNGSIRWKLDRATVLAFRERYMLTAEVARRLGCRNRDVRAIMAARGVEPAHVLRDDRGLVWERAEMEGAMLAARE